jgi:hypothetical protein
MKQSPTTVGPLWRDPWAAAAILGVVPMILKSLGAPVGEPVAEDFDFLHYALYSAHPSLFDGGGSLAFWRPLPHQTYYAVLAKVILAHPGWIAILHAVLLAATSLALYATFRTNFSRPWAVGIATFPLLAESTRTLLAWPGQIVDLGALFFSAIALHEASRRRLPSALAAVLASLLCKEVAVVTALMIPWLPSTLEPRERRRWFFATAGLTAAWGIAYLLVRRHAGLELPHHLEAGAVNPVTMPERLAWAFVNSLRSTMSLPGHATAYDIPVLALLVALLGFAGQRCIKDASARGRVRARLPWMVWGVSWFALATAPLVVMHPYWQPNRGAFGSVGTAVAAVALLGSAHPVLPGVLVAARLAMLALSPGPPPSITLLPPETGAFMDFQKLVRLERLMASTRRALHDRFPTLPSGARVGYHGMPRLATYAFGGDRALQLWYRDTTLRWIKFQDVLRQDSVVVTIVEFEAHADRQIVLVDLEAVRKLVRGRELYQARRPEEALAELAVAEGLQRDSGALFFRSMVAGRRALSLIMLGADDQAELEAQRCLTLHRDNADGHLVLALLWGDRGRFAEAEAQVDTVLRIEPQYVGAERLREVLRAGRAGRLPALP